MSLGGTLHKLITGKRSLTEAEAQANLRSILQIVAFAHCIGILIRQINLRRFIYEIEPGLVNSDKSVRFKELFMSCVL